MSIRWLFCLEKSCSPRIESPRPKFIPSSNERCWTESGADQFQNAIAELHELHQDLRRPLTDLAVPSRGRLEKLLQSFQSIFGVLVLLLLLLQIGPAFPEHRERRIDLSLFSFIQNNSEHFPDVLHRFKMVAPVAHHMDKFHDPPPLQLADAVAHVRARHRESL